MKICKNIFLMLCLIIIGACGSSGGDSGPSVGPTIPVDPPISLTIDGEPVIAYTDMESAPNTGWSKANPNKGAAVTVWGRNLGSTRNDSYITVGNVKLTENKDYAIWGEAWPTPFWQRITFYLNSNMLKGNTNITVTIGGKTSNPLPFTIRDGRIFFVDKNVTMGDGDHDTPFNYQRSFQYEMFEALIPGDIVYYRGGAYERMGIWTNSPDKAKSFLWFDKKFNHKDGTKEKPIAFIAYPGEKPLFKETKNSYGLGAAGLGNDYLVLSGFTMDMPYRVIGVGGNYCRVVGNDVIGMKENGNGTGHIVTGSSGAKILGNAIHGGRSKDRLDHAIYLSGAPVEEGAHVGWNYIYDNNFLRGPEISINHQENRVPAGLNVKSHFIFSNIVDCSPQRATVINVYDLSYDEGDPLDPEPVFIYNNIFINAGVKDYSNMDIGYAHAFKATGDHTRIYNNLFYNTAFLGASFGGKAGHYSHQFVNNMMIMNSDIQITDNKHYYLNHYDTEGKVNIEKNMFYDIGSKGVYHYMSGVTGTKGYDKSINMTDKDPKFINPSEDANKLDFRLQGSSPAIDAGKSVLLDVEKLPKYAPITRDIFFRTRKGNFDIGPLEYIK